MRKLAKLLKTEISGDLQDLAKMLQSKGRGKDTILAHITPKEAELLKKRGGSGTRNPDTGLLEFDPETAALPDVAVTASPDVSTPAPDVYVPETVTQSAATPQYGTPSGEQIVAANLPAGNEPGLSTYEVGYAGGPVSPSFSTPMPSVAPPDLSTTQSEDATALSEAGLSTTVPSSKGFFGKMTGDQLARLGLAGVGGLAGALQARKGAKQIEAAQREQQAMAQPYQKMGNELIGQASKGILSPASQQAYQAAQAQLTQNAQNRGAVGVEQAQNQLAMIRTNLLNNQMQYGLQIAQVGDRMALGAIQTGLQLDQQLNQTSQAFYTQLASIAAGLPIVRQ